MAVHQVRSVRIVLFSDPQFVDAANDNLRLQLSSPAIDAGDNAALSEEITTDLDGNPRFVDIPGVSDTGNGTPPIVDLGVYEAQYVSTGIIMWIKMLPGLLPIMGARGLMHL